MAAGTPPRAPFAALELIPSDRRDAASAALAAAFGPAKPTQLAPLAGGASAQIFRVEVKGRDYLLRLERPRSALRDPDRGFACMRIAAEAGIAPRLLYADAESAVAIMDFVPTQPLETFAGGPEALARELGALVARLQQAPLFPALGDYPAIVGRMLSFLVGAGLFAPGLLDAHAESAARIRDAYPWDSAALVSSHNDPNPRNILYDGERLWLVDWETGYRNDPLVDLAILTHELAATPGLEDAMLRARFGRPPDGLVRARLRLMQALTRLYYACLLFMSALPAPADEPETDLAAPTVAGFRAAVADGRLAPASPALMRVLGKMQLAGFIALASGRAFDEALAIVRRG